MTQMDRIPVSFFIAVISSLISVANAQPVSEQQAYETAMHFLAGDNAAQSGAPKRGVTASALKMDYTAKTGRKNDFYVFNRSEGGFVIVSADARTVKPVLGYSDNGRFDADNIPPALQYILSGYQEQIDYARANVASQRGTLQTTVPRGTPVVEPLIKTKWDQNDPYNRLCPRVDGGESYTGCTATALAQIMNYWHWPERGTGLHHDSRADTLFVDFSKSVYDWDNMAITYTPDTPQVKIDAVARLMYDCGIALNMNYILNSGLSNDYFLAPAFINYFNYSCDARKIDRIDYVAEWDSIMIAELDAARPIIYSGYDYSEYDQIIGHAFICDGYDSEHYFHYNLGWNGYCDGYYLSNSISVDSYPFNDNQSVIIGIYPDYNDEYRDGMPVCYLDVDGNAELHDIIRYRDSVDIIIPDSARIGDKFYPVKSIANYAFGNRSYGCKNIIMSGTVENIGCEAFSCFQELSDLHIPASVKSIGKAAFWECPKLESITVDESNRYYYVPQGSNVLMEIGTGYLVRACNNSIIPTEEVTVIGENACDCLDSLGVIRFPNVTTIENDAFADCSNLCAIYFGTSLSTIGERVFRGCNSLKDIYLYSESAPIVGVNAIPAGVTIHVKASAMDSFSVPEWSAYNLVADIEDATAVPMAPAAKQEPQYYDLLGRPVPPGYRGFAITK